MATMKTKTAPRAPKENSGSGKTGSEKSGSGKTGSASETVSTHEHVGVILRRAREERDLTIDMVADELMIRRFYLDVLEKGIFEDLPERVYAIGFVKNYASYLGLDSRTMVEQFKRDAYGSRQGMPYQVTLNMPEPVAHSVVPGRSAIIVAIVVLIVLVAGVIWMAQADKTMVDTIPEPIETAEAMAADIPVPSVPSPSVPTAPVAEGNDAEAMQDAEDVSSEPTGFIGSDMSATQKNIPMGNEAGDNASQAVVSNGATTNANTHPDSAVNGQVNSAAAAPHETALANVKNHRVLEAVQASWVEVRDERNTILFTSILKKGQVLPLPDGSRLTVTTGNAGGLRMLIDGKPQPVFGQVNEVKRNMVILPRPLDRH